VTGRDFSGAKLEKFTSIGSRFENCRFEKMRIGDTSLGAGMALSEYLDCSFDGSRLRHGSGYCRFVRCSFRKVELRDWQSEYVELVDCVISGKVRSTTFWGRPPEEKARARYESNLRWLEREGLPIPGGYRELALREVNEFHGNDFTDAELIDVEFRNGIDLARQRLPTGDDYLYLPAAEATVAQAAARLAQHPADEVSERAQRFLRNVLGRSLAEGQQQLLLREKDFQARGVKPHIEIAFEALRQAAARDPERDVHIRRD
jgi:hypothetical protein